MNKIRDLLIVSGIIFVGAASAGIPNWKRTSKLPSAVEGVAPSNGRLRACIGYRETDHQWGNGERLCAPQFGYFGVDDPGGPEGPSERIDVSGVCCPLPSADVLSSESFYAASACPDDAVVTGSLQKFDHGEPRVLVKCTRLNTKRYQLGPAQPALYWGDGYAGWQGSTRIDRENIPPGIRFAQGRTSKTSWDVDGCVGFPWGSLLVEKKSKYCAGFEFKQLQYRGMQGDPPAGTAVKMFPECSQVEYSSEAGAADCNAQGTG